MSRMGEGLEGVEVWGLAARRAQQQLQQQPHADGGHQGLGRMGAHVRHQFCVHEESLVGKAAVR